MAILKNSAHGRVTAVAGGLNWFIIGTGYYAVRESTRQYIETNHPDLNINDFRGKVGLSAFTASLTGAVYGGAVRGPRSILPGAIMFGLIGGAGQGLYTRLDTKHYEQKVEEIMLEEDGVSPRHVGWKEKAFNSRWSPLKKMTAEEFELAMQNKIDRIDIEMALVRDEIERLKGELLVEKEKERLESLRESQGTLNSMSNEQSKK